VELGIVLDDHRRPLDTAARASARLRGRELARGWNSPSALADSRINGPPGHRAGLCSLWSVISTPDCRPDSVDAVPYHGRQVDQGSVAFSPVVQTSTTLGTIIGRRR
jgi:hypothetical protein